MGLNMVGLVEFIFYHRMIVGTILFNIKYYLYMTKLIRRAL